MLETNRQYLEQLLDWSRADGHPVYVVGGTLRDRALERECSDIDMASSRATQLAERFAAAHGLPRVPLDSTPGREMIRVVMEGETYFDFATLQGQTLEDDLSSRDFTINAMGLALEDFLNDSSDVVDPHHGLSDIQNKIIRQLPGPVFEEDPLRMLRAFRFANTLQFRLDPDTLASIAEHPQAIGGIAGERIHYELLLILETPQSQVQPLVDTGLLQTLIPELEENGGGASGLDLLNQLEPILNHPQSLFPDHGEIMSQTLQSGHRTALIKMAALLFPLYKPGSPVVEILKRLRFSNRDIHFIDRTLALYRHLHDKDRFNLDNPDSSCLYRFCKSGEELVVPAVLLTSAAHREPGESDKKFGDSLNRAADFYYNHYLPAQARPVLLNGDVLEKTFKLKPSPKFKTILDRVEEARVLGRINTQEQAQNMAKELIENL